MYVDYLCRYLILPFCVFKLSLMVFFLSYYHFVFVLFTVFKNLFNENQCKLEKMTSFENYMSLEK